MPKRLPDCLYGTYDDVEEYLLGIDASAYRRNRDYVDGAVTFLSPLISHGIVSTRDVAAVVLRRFKKHEARKLLQEMGWREFFHRVWQARGDDIFWDLTSDQKRHVDPCMSANIMDAKTGVVAIDDAIRELYETGYMHNHARMWVAALAGNVAQTHWLECARWMHYHLLDGDLASNSLSWQWIVGTFSARKYIANQNNVNKYSRKRQAHTFLDVPYETLRTMDVPGELAERRPLDMPPTELPPSTITPDDIADGTTVLLHSMWNLNARWDGGVGATTHDTTPHTTTTTTADDAGKGPSASAGRAEPLRVLVLEPSHYKQWPVSARRIAFVMHWAAQIPNLHVWSGEVADLLPAAKVDACRVVTQEYPATKHWPGTHVDRPWLYPKTTGFYPSFFKFWREARSELGL